MRKSLCLMPLALMALAACSGSGGGTSGGGSIFGSSSGGGSSSSSGSSPTALSAFVLNLISTDTNETALPVDLTTVMLDTSSEDPTVYASLFAAGSSSGS